MTPKEVIANVTWWDADENGESERDVGYWTAQNILDALDAYGYEIKEKDGTQDVETGKLKEINEG